MFRRYFMTAKASEIFRVSIEVRGGGVVCGLTTAARITVTACDNIQDELKL